MDVNMKKISVCLLLHIVGNACCESTVHEPEWISQDVIQVAQEATDTKKLGCECNCPRFPRPVDCGEVLTNGDNVSGVYTIHPKSRIIECEHLEVYCDMHTDGGGWTVIQRRGDYMNAENYFAKNWKTYKKGFGHLKKEFWVGNDNIHALTNQDSYSVRIDMRRMNGDTAFALYDIFFIDDEERNYKLHIEGYSGTSGDAISNHDFSLFYTHDHPNFPAGRKAGEPQHAGGWWLNTFPSSNLNGLNRQGLGNGEDRKGIVWSSFGEVNYVESLAFTEIKIRPKRFNL